MWFRDWGLAEGESIHVMGSLPLLGSWKPQQAPRMTRLASPHWQLEVSITLQQSDSKSTFSFTLSEYLSAWKRQGVIVMQALVDIADFPVSYQYVVVSRDGQHIPEQGPEREAVLSAGASEFNAKLLFIGRPVIGRPDNAASGTNEMSSRQ